MTKRFGLLDFILLLGVVASVFGLIWNRKQAEDLQRSVVELRKTAGELVVDDPNLFGCTSGSRCAASERMTSTFLTAQYIL